MGEFIEAAKAYFLVLPTGSTALRAVLWQKGYPSQSLTCHKSNSGPELQELVPLAAGMLRLRKYLYATEYTI
jgi:hypothetical protein